MMEAMLKEGAAQLQVFVEAGCSACERAKRLTREVAGDYPQLAVSVMNIGDARARHAEVFAVPTFVLDGRVLSLGNPQMSRLRGEIESLLRDRGLL